jgi:hypothetical protein
MRIQPRQHLLEIWKAVVTASLQDRTWTWGGRDKANSISDAEQLLCIMYPGTVVDSFRIASPDGTVDDDVLVALKGIGDGVEITQMMLKCIGEYLRTYRDPDGLPVFSGGSYFSTVSGSDLTPDQSALDVVDSYSMSVTLSLATLAYLQELRPSVTRERILTEMDELRTLASDRLTAAMVGLLRSFAVNVFKSDDEKGRILRRNVNQSGLGDRQVMDGLQAALAPVRASLIRELSVGSALGVTQDLENPNLLFEVGWSWGVVEDAPVEVLGAKGTQRVGYAEQRPYVYFTGAALDGIEDLFSDRTRILQLLDLPQQRLATALQLRYTLVREYWATVALFGTERWPVEDIPWKTSDGEESDYFSLLVASIAMQDLALRRATDTDLRRLYRILADLASRGRLTRRPVGDDPAVGLHSPGVPLSLQGGERLGPPLQWMVSNFSALLLKRTVRLAQLAQTTDLRNQLLDLASQIWDHLQLRRIRSGDARNLWDQTEELYGARGLEGSTQPSWYFTERVVECLVSAAEVVIKPPIRSAGLDEYAADLLNEAEHLYDKELLAGSSHDLRERLVKVRLTIERARAVQPDRPGSAASLAVAVLRDLDELAAARQGTVGG